MSDYAGDYSEVDLGADDTTEFPDGFWDDLPRPLYWRVLVMPIRPKKVSSGGIIVPIAAQEAQQYLNYMGRVLALGDMAGKSEKLGARGDGVATAPGFPNVGQHVIYGRYAGQRVTYKGVKLLWINDDEILGTVSDPETLQIHL